jgi:hypothetical protein
MIIFSRYAHNEKMNFSKCSKDFKSYDASLPEIHEAFSGVDTKNNY